MARASISIREAVSPPAPPSIVRELRAFRWEGRAARKTITSTALTSPRPIVVETLVNQFWTPRQRAAHSLHEVSYRACFKPQLPRFFIERLTRPGDVIYDPFMGRGTTPLEAALLGRTPVGSDINPLSTILASPRLTPPRLEEVLGRLQDLDLAAAAGEYRQDLEVFYHPETLRELCALRQYLIDRQRRSLMDTVDRWIRMVAVNRLTGHSSGFFSVYTLPPNQATSLQSQAKINAARGQIPPRRDIRALIAAKSESLLRDCDEPTHDVLRRAARGMRLLARPASETAELADGSVDLVVTSPPFLDVVDYAADNWLRCWFCGIDGERPPLVVHKKLADWQTAMTMVFRELTRVLRPGGHVAFEVGEIRRGRVKLEETVLPCGVAGGLQPLLVLINAQRFTKTANCWGISNNRKGTNTNRIVLFRKP